MCFLCQSFNLTQGETTGWSSQVGRLEQVSYWILEQETSKEELWTSFKTPGDLFLQMLTELLRLSWRTEFTRPSFSRVCHPGKCAYLFFILHVLVISCGVFYLSCMFWLHLSICPGETPPFSRFTNLTRLRGKEGVVIYRECSVTHKTGGAWR